MLQYQIIMYAKNIKHAILNRIVTAQQFFCHIEDSKPQAAKPATAK
jgi:hypothetical protein